MKRLQKEKNINCLLNDINRIETTEIVCAYKHESTDKILHSFRKKTI